MAGGNAGDLTAASMPRASATRRRIASERVGRGSGCAAIQASRASSIRRSKRALTSSLSTRGRPRRDFLPVSIDMRDLYRHLMRTAREIEPYPDRPNHNRTRSSIMAEKPDTTNLPAEGGKPETYASCA
jgi:hypothetical protein